MDTNDASAWWKLCGGSKARENLQGNGALQRRRSWYNKVERGQETPQLEAIKKVGPMVKATCHLWSVVYIFWLATFVLTYRAKSFVASTMGNLIQEFVFLDR